MEISASMVKELRDITGAGMIDCKRALTLLDGDILAAKHWLRLKGTAVFRGHHFNYEVAAKEEADRERLKLSKQNTD